MSEELRQRVEALENAVGTLQQELREEREERQAAERREDDLRERVGELESELETTNELLGSVARKAGANLDRVQELQSRELEKGAHLLADHVFPEDVSISDGQLERITKDDGQHYYRAPGSEDGLQRGGGVAHSTADLLPLQRLARYDDEMLASVAKTRPDELAAKAWRQRDETGRYGLWSKGSGDVRVYLRSSALAEWIRSTEAGISKSYSQELARRVLDSMRDLAKDRLVKTRQKHEKDGLQYPELQVELRSHVELPGETTPADAPATSGVAGAD